MLQTQRITADVLKMQPRPRKSVNRRSVLLGLLGVLVVCGVTPYNDYALNNTFLVGNNLPLGVIMLAFLFVVFVNGPLSRWRPDWAFHAGELCVALSMTLVSCALPSSGLMRYLPGSVVGPFFHARSNTEFRAILLSLDVPEWIFPRFAGGTRASGLYDQLTTGFFGRWTEVDAQGRPTRYPYLAWLQPAIAWGVFIFAMYGALLCMVMIVRRQWVDNERLQFPLAQIQLSLIETPRRGRWLNATMRSRGFWVAFAAVFFLHGWNALGEYRPQYFERIPVYYNLWGMFSEPPWKFVDAKLKDAAVFFTVVGVTYFLASPIAFSLWAFYILHQVYRMVLGSYWGDASTPGTNDQHFGAVVAFALSLLWVGRHHWVVVVKQAFRGRRYPERAGKYAPRAVAFWGLVACSWTMVAWLTVAGCTFLGACVMVLLLLTLFMVITRVVAEAGLVHGQLQVPIYKPWTWLSLAGFQRPVPMETFYLSAMLQSVHYDFREPMPVYASHGFKMADVAAGDGASFDSRQRRLFVWCLIGALFVGYWTTWGSTLWTEYTYATTRDERAENPINRWGTYDNTRYSIVDATVQYARGNYNAPHNPWGHFSFGFAFTTFLSFMRLRYTWWPLHPIGYLMIGTYPGAHLWLSIFCGWLAKVTILRYGGTKLYAAAKPFFIGLIVGESAAAGFWLVMSIALSTMGMPYKAINIMPG